MSDAFEVGGENQMEFCTTSAYVTLTSAYVYNMTT